MIVCVCNRLKDSVCRATAADGRCRGVGCIYRLNGGRIRCGRCVPMMREILAAHAPTLSTSRPAQVGMEEIVGVRA
jgi:bacterioferritin-associated ferredoxin